MGRLGEQVEGLDGRERVAAIGEGAYVPGQGRGIAGEVDEAPRRQLAEEIGAPGRQPAAGWVENGDVGTRLGQGGALEGFREPRGHDIHVGELGDPQVVPEIPGGDRIGLDSRHAVESARQAQGEEAGAGEELESVASTAGGVPDRLGQRVVQEPVRLEEDAGGDVETIVADAETVALVGESGSGKTTLLRMFNRLEEPTAGAALVGNRDVREQDPIELRRHTGYVLQEGGLLPHWTVGRNVELVPELLGWSTDTRRRRADELLDTVGLDPALYRDRFPRALSGGQRQRVAFARALAADPGVILLDEPFGALDAITRLELQEEFLRLKTSFAKTMLIVTHDLAEAFRLADRVAVMKDGRIHQLGPGEDLLARPATDYVRSLLDHVQRSLT